MDWACMLANTTGTVDQELLLRYENLVAENRILKAQIQGRLLLCDAEKITLVEIGHRVGHKTLEEVAATAQPDTTLGWYRKLIAHKIDRGWSKFRQLMLLEIDSESSFFPSFHPSNTPTALKRCQKALTTHQG